MKFMNLSYWIEYRTVNVSKGSLEVNVSAVKGNRRKSWRLAAIFNYLLAPGSSWRICGLKIKLFKKGGRSNPINYSSIRLTLGGKLLKSVLCNGIKFDLKIYGQKGESA